MNSLFEAHLESGNFHHGYFLAGGGGASVRAALAAASAILGVPEEKLGAHPDFYRERFSLFGIAEARALKRRASGRPFAGGGKVFLLELSSFTAESSNALLKMFEEPPEGTHFFVCVPGAAAVTPTLRSRFAVVEAAPGKTGGAAEAAARDFLAAAVPARFAFAKKIGNDRDKAEELLNGLEEALAAEAERAAEAGAVPPVSALEAVADARAALSERGSGPKMALERLAVVLPKMLL